MLDVQSLEKAYGSKPAVRGISFSVEKGTVLGFLGPNGAGKSTTMRMIAGVLEPEAGASDRGAVAGVTAPAIEIAAPGPH